MIQDEKTLDPNLEPGCTQTSCNLQLDLLSEADMV